jgi:hypothetical protein
MELSLKMKKAIILISCLALLAGCGGWKRYDPPGPMPADDLDIPEPAEREYSVYPDLLEQQVTRQMVEMLDLSRQLRNLTGNRKEAYNANAFDEVDDSSWFTNRNHRRAMSLEEIRKGPDTGPGPDKSGKWTVVRAKSEGVTPGFTIRDPLGDHYLVKFDPIGYPELVTGAEVVSTKLFYAAGYNVPENYITWFRAEDLVLGDKVKFSDENGLRREMEQEDLERLLGSIEKQPDGRYRALASRYIEGIPIGPFKYTGSRKDDPNDIVPHKHRRELRGLRVIAAWLNHVDTKSGNTLDSYVTEDGKRFIRHYLIDFGTTLGSAAHSPQTPKTGQENQVDPHEIARNILTLGLEVEDWEKAGGFEFNSVGFFESGLFDPGEFKFSVPNAAFENCTDKDGFWGAKIVMSFSDDQLEAAVGEGRYSDPAAAEYLVRIIGERRDKTGRYWFSRVSPLDDFTLSRSEGGYLLGFRDLSVEYGFVDPKETDYIYGVSINGKETGGDEATGGRTGIRIPAGGAGVTGEDTQLEVRIVTIRGGVMGKGIRIYIDIDGSSGEYSLTGVERE